MTLCHVLSQRAIGLQRHSFNHQQTEDWQKNHQEPVKSQISSDTVEGPNNSLGNILKIGCIFPEFEEKLKNTTVSVTERFAKRKRLILLIVNSY